MVKKGLYIGLLTVLLCSCEVIDQADRLIPVLPEGLSAGRTHLLVEYTGFRCVNCPTAAQTAQEMQQTYGDRLVVVAMHPATNAFTQGKYDYTCPEADECYRYTGGTATTPFPTGTIDISRTDGEYLADPAEWATLLMRALRYTAAPVLAVTAAADTLSREITVTAQTYSEYTTDCRMACWLVEDSVPGVQAMPDGTVNTAYYHRHMLRAAAEDGIWGSPLMIGTSLSARTLTMPLPDGCDWRHCAIVVLLLDQDDYHVLQTKQTKIQSKQ